MSTSRMDIFKAAGLERKMVTSSSPSPESVLVDDTNAFTKEDIRKALPAQLKIKVSDELVNKINSISLDPLVADEIRDNFVGYASVMKDGKFKVEQYLEACAYVTYKMMGYSNKDAYGLTFPDRVRKMRADGKDDKHISAFVAAYHKNKLVNIILEQAVIPACILNQDLYQQALNQQAHLMIHAQSEKVQCEAANSILNALKRPETSKIEMDVNIKDNSGISELKNVMMQVASHQAKQIQAGETTKTIAHADLFDAEGNQI